MTHHKRTARKLRRPRADAFTLVEVLIVVIILGILAALVVPQFSSADSETRENSTKMNLFRIRQQLEIYKQQHAGGAYPTYANFADQMLMATNLAGQTAAAGTPGYNFGPYVRDIPANPFTGVNDVSNDPSNDVTKGWYYNESTGEFRAADSDEHAVW